MLDLFSHLARCHAVRLASLGTALAILLAGLGASLLMPRQAHAAAPPQIRLFTEAISAPAATSLTFGFTLTGLSLTNDTITVTGSTQTESSKSTAGIFGTVGVQATLQESSVAPCWSANLAPATFCTDRNAPGDGNPSAGANLAVVSGATVTLPASVMKDGAVIKCLLSNSRPQIFLKKQITGSAPDGGLFNLTIAGANAGPGTNPALNVGSGGTTTGIGVDADSVVSLTETAGTGTSMSNYVSGVKCRDFAGVLYTQGVSGSGGSFVVTSPSASAQGNAQSLICTLTNTALPSVIIAKRSVGKAGTFNFTLSALNNFTDILTTTSGATVTSAAVNVGTVGVAATVVETPASAAGYAVSTSCVDANSGITGNLGSITSNTNTATIPAANMKTRAAYTCTFVNTKLTSITTTKTASASPLLTGVAGQFYTVNVSVAYATTTAALSLSDTLPTGMTLSGPPTVVSGTATLSGCPGAGSNITGCTVAAGAPVGTFSVKIPVNIAAGAIGPGGGTNVVNLSGGGDAACTAAASESCDATTPVTPVAPPNPALQIVKKVLSGSGSNLFRFALSGLSAATDAITVVGAAQQNGAAGITGTTGQAASIGETSPAGWPAAPVSASCVDSNAATSGNPTGPLGTLSNNVLSIPAARMVNGATLICTFVNSYSFSITGRVFTDNGAGSGTANNGVVDGSESGAAGVTVSLTNCVSSAPIAVVTSDGSGNYALPVAFSTATGASLCVDKTNRGARMPTGASIVSMALPLGTAVASGGTSYTHTHPSTVTDRIAFNWNGAGHYGLNFGDVGPNTFAADGAKSGQAGNTVSYAHTFTAQTGGSVSFSIASAVAQPALGSWSEKIFADVGCTGALQVGAALLYPPAANVAATAGQSICIIMQEFIPATAPDGYQNAVTVQASFSFANALPALMITSSVSDILTVSSSALELKKEVRNVTTGSVFGINNQARSGETLEYRITYTNNGTSPVTSLSVADITPNHTTFVSAIDATTPATVVSCQKQTPANPVPAAPVICAFIQVSGGTGPVKLQFVGPVEPGASGTVLFQVKVD